MEYLFAAQSAALLALTAFYIRERNWRITLGRQNDQLSRDFWNLVSREDEFERLGRQRRESLDRYNAKKRAGRAAKK